MVEDISNKTLAILLIAAIAVSLGGTIFSLNKLASLTGGEGGATGFITNPTGQARINVTSTASLRFSIATLDFGNGYVNTTGGNQYCSMASNNTAGYKDATTRCVGFNAAATLISLEIENDGNTNLTLTLTSDKNAATFIGGTNPGFKFYASNNSTGSCPTPNVMGWTDVNTTAMNICSVAAGLGFLDSADSMDIHLNVTIPYNSLTGQQTATLTATGTAV